MYCAYIQVLSCSLHISNPRCPNFVRDHGYSLVEPQSVTYHVLYSDILLGLLSQK